MSNNSLAIPAAIVIAAAFIAAAIYFSGAAVPNSPTAPNATGGGQEVPEVTEADHIRGNPNAPIVLVEYSDFDCPFCQQFHQTLKRIMDEYGTEGKVAWVYRQFPLEQLHPNAPRLAEASECVAELGGDDAFWRFADILFEEKPQNDFTEIERLPEFATQAGVDRQSFETCLNSGRYEDKVAASVQEAINIGGRGTPHTVVLVGDQSGVINGAQPYAAVKQIIDNLLQQIEGGEI